MSSVDSGLAQTLQAHAGLAVRADNNKAPAVVSVPGFPAHLVHLWDFRKGELVEKVAPPHPRVYEAATVASLAELINEFVGNAELAPADDPVAPVSDSVVVTTRPLVFVWINHGKVEAVLNEAGDRRERLTLRLNQSDPFNALLSMHGSWLGQREFVEALRVNINGSYTPSTVIDIVRALKWSQNEQGESTVQTGRASFGRRVEAAIAGVDETDLRSIEDLSITIPVYSDLFSGDEGHSTLIYSTFRCAVDVHPTEQKVILKIKAGETERNLRDLDLQIRRMLREVINVDLLDRVRIFFGTPD